MTVIKMPPVPPIRRVVTTHDARGKAVTMLDAPASNTRTSEHGTASTLIWCSDECPAEIWTPEDYGKRSIPRQPPANGSRFTVIDFAPGCPGMMHRTDTIDYVACLSGEIDMALDDSEVHMKAGDVMVQQGTNHSWINRGTETARLAFVLLDAKTRSGMMRPRPPRPPQPPEFIGPSPEPPIRRIVTAHDAIGKAIVSIDGPAINHRWSDRGNISTLLWSTDESPADIWTAEDYGERELPTQPPARGTRFCINDYPPGTPGRMHRTDTLDYALLLAGTVRMDMDDSSVALNAGDIVIQQGTNHSWVNVGDETARLAFVLIDAKRKLS